MKKLVFLLIAFCTPVGLLAQSSAGEKMTSGLSIALIIAVVLAVYMAVKLQKVQRENLSLRAQLKQQNEK